MKKFITLITIFLFVINTKAQNVVFDWAKHIGSTDNDSGRSITTDASGNILIAGYFNDTVDFDPGPGIFNLTAAGSRDIFIAKFNALGNFLWAKRMGGTDTDFVMYMTLDNAGNIYTTGFFQGTADFDPGPNTFNLTSTGTDNTFVSKLDPSGNFIWAKQFNGSASNVGNSIAVDSSGNVYTIGSFRDTVDFDPGVSIFNMTSNGNEDIYITKLDVAGNFLWAKKIGGTDSDIGTDLKIDVSGSNIYTTGEFRETVDFDPNSGIFNLTSAGARDIFVLKLTNTGDLVWAKKMGGSNSDRGHSLALDDFNNYIYITGDYSDTADFDPGIGVFNLTAIGGDDCFISKLDTSGNFVWAKSIGGPGVEETGNSIKLNAAGEIFVTGEFMGTCDFDPGINTFNLSAIGISDTFILKLDATGNFVWAVQLGGPGNINVESWSSAIDASDNIYTTGNFTGTVDFDQGSSVFNLTSTGLKDVFVHKMHSESLNVSTITFKDQFKLYPNPTYNLIRIDLGETDKDILVNVRNQLAQIIPTEIRSYADYLELSLTGSGGLYFIEIKTKSGEAIHFKVLKI